MKIDIALSWIMIGIYLQLFFVSYKFEVYVKAQWIIQLIDPVTKERILF